MIYNEYIINYSLGKNQNPQEEKTMKTSSID